MAKRWSVLAAVLVLVMAVAPMDALGKKKKKKKPSPPPPPVEQVVEGSVMFPAPFVDTASPPNTACFAGVHRRAVLAFGDASQGYLGYHFDVDLATWGGTFVLEPTGGSPDFDVIFYSDFGANPNTAPAETVTYQERGAGGEEGDIPANMNHVIVCMFSGFDASFKYTGTGPGGGAPAPAGSPGGSPTPSPTST